MKLYIIQEVYPYEGILIMGIYSNRELAEEYVAALEGTVDGVHYRIIERALDAKPWRLE